MYSLIRQIHGGKFVIATALGPLTSAPRGVVYYINVDDDNMDDVEDLDDPRLVDMTLATPHTVRDDIIGRRPAISGCVEPAFADTHAETSGSEAASWTCSTLSGIGAVIRDLPRARRRFRVARAR